MSAELATINILATLPYYTEGPVVDDRGNLFFTTLAGGQILKLPPGGEPEEWARTSCPNGQLILPDGDHVVCDPALHAVLRFSRDGRLLAHCVDGECAGVAIHSPNDVVADLAGNLFFSDSVRHTGSVFKMSADGHEQVVLDNLDYPNGLAISPDQQWLYVAESYRNRILRILLNHDGDKQLLIDLPQHPSGRDTDQLPDGLTVDAAGNIWVAHYGMQCIHQVSPAGKLMRTIDTGLRLTSNLVLADKYMFVTGGRGEPGPGSVIRITI